MPAPHFPRIVTTCRVPADDLRDACGTCPWNPDDHPETPTRIEVLRAMLTEDLPPLPPWVLAGAALTAVLLDLGGVL